MTGIAFPPQSLRAQISSAIHLVIQVGRLEDGRRKVMSLQEINGMEGDDVVTVDAAAEDRELLDGLGNGGDDQVVDRAGVLGLLEAVEVLHRARVDGELEVEVRDRLLREREALGDEAVAG